MQENHEHFKAIEDENAPTVEESADKWWSPHL